MLSYRYGCLRTECRMVHTYSSWQYDQLRLLPIINCLKIMVKRYIFLVICSLKFGSLMLAFKKNISTVIVPHLWGQKHSVSTSSVEWKGYLKDRKTFASTALILLLFLIALSVFWKWVSTLKISAMPSNFCCSYWESEPAYWWSILVDGFSLL